MSYYENQQWPAVGNQAAWDQQTPPARSGASSVVPREDLAAFGSQLEEVDRAIENLFKSGKIFNMPPRRDPTPLGQGPARSYPAEFDPRMGNNGASRHTSVSDFGDARSYSGSNLQNFYANQRHQPRASEAEQVLQAKRRMAAQRERELRNYHQEQQYNRTELSTYGGKPDRTISPGSGMSEEERRELIARQRSALYGEGPYPENGGFTDENGTARPGTQGSNPATTRHSPLGFASQNGPSDSGNEQVPPQGQSQSQQQRSRANSTSSPSSNQAANFTLFDTQQSSRTSTSSPGGSPPRQGKPAGGPTVAPIGTRPTQVSNPALNKRSTTPLPSPLSHGFAASKEENGHSTNGDRATTSAATNHPTTAQDTGLGWGSKSAVWGNKSLGVQASVW